MPVRKSLPTSRVLARVVVGTQSLPLFVKQARADSGSRLAELQIAIGAESEPCFPRQVMVEFDNHREESPGDAEEAGNSLEPKRVFEGVRGSITFASVVAQRVRKARHSPGASGGPRLALQSSVEAPQRRGRRQPDSSRFSDDTHACPLPRPWTAKLSLQI
jgi:hypothetical protein